MASILIVDDNPVNRRFLGTLLGRHGHSVAAVRDGAEAIAEVKKGKPDVIVADVLMPVMDGYEMLRRLRGDVDTEGVPVVFFTAHYGGRSMALADGAAWFLTNAQAGDLPKVVERVLAGETQVIAENSSASATDRPRANLPT